MEPRPSSPQENQIEASTEEAIPNTGLVVLVVSENAGNNAAQMPDEIPIAGKIPIDNRNNTPVF